jgi:Domain of unknown function (DUF4440)
MTSRSALIPVLCVLLFLCACTLWPEQRPYTSNWAQSTGGESLERNFWKEIKAKNWTELERHIAANFTSLNSNGMNDRPGALARFKTLEVEDYNFADVDTQMNGNTFVVTYTLILRGARNGKPLSTEPRRMMSVWQQQKTGWVIIAHTSIDPPSN